jgi:hypothetical protein
VLKSWTTSSALRCAPSSAWCACLFEAPRPALSAVLGRAQCVKLEKVRGTKQSIEIAEEFRHLTLQVIGESILSMTPEESDSVFPHLYLPIMVRLVVHAL